MIIRKEVHNIDGVQTVEYSTWATEETLPFLKAYSQFGDEHLMKVGTQVRIRAEHVDKIAEWCGATVNNSDTIQ